MIASSIRTRSAATDPPPPGYAADMWARLSALLLAVAATALLGACGSSTGQPKRTADARKEALRFFAADTPFVALVDPSPGGVSDPTATLQEVGSNDVVSAFAANDLSFVTRQRIPTDDLASLLEVSDPTLESEDSQVAVGVTPSGRPDENALVVVVTARSDETADAVREAAARAGMRRDGTYDQADIYAGKHAAMAV